MGMKNKGKEKSEFVYGGELNCKRGYINGIELPYPKSFDMKLEGVGGGGWMVRV